MKCKIFLRLFSKIQLEYFLISGKAIDHVNMCRLYDAASSFTYLAVEFEVAELEEVEELDPLARLFEIARRARDLSNEQQVIFNAFLLLCSNKFI